MPVTPYRIIVDVIGDAVHIASRHGDRPQLLLACPLERLDNNRLAYPCDLSRAMRL